MYYYVHAAYYSNSTRGNFSLSLNHAVYLKPVRATVKSSLSEKSQFLEGVCVYAVECLPFF